MILISSLSPTVFSSIQAKEYKNDRQSKLPDLTGFIQIVEFDDFHYIKYSVNNSGDGPENNFSCKVTIYPFGTFLFRNSFFEILYKLVSPQVLYWITLPFHLLHISPSFIACQTTTSTTPLLPGESYQNYVGYPIDGQVQNYINHKICIITEIVVDPDNIIAESNENNNREIIRWWLPLKNEPEKSK
jgi:hypothetical protein